MKGKTQITDKLDKVLLSWLVEKDLKIQNEASKSYFTILSDHENILHKNSKAVSQVLYKQRFFTINLTYLLELSKSSQNEGTVLLALSFMIKSLPSLMILNEIERIYPLMIKSISSTESALIEAGLKTLETFILHSRKVVEDNLSTITKNLIDLLSFEMSPQVRVSSLECLEEISTFPYHLLFPIKEEILDGIDISLDDRRRDVRSQAVRCKMFWVLALTKE